MRNVTIVESNVEPNKEHLWFYNGKLKWFGPNGWEEIYSQASSPTTTPEPVTGSIRFTNNTNTYIQIYGMLYIEDTASPPMLPGETYILRYISNGVAVYNLPYLMPFDFLKITVFRGKKHENIPYIIDTDTITNGVIYKFPEGLSWEEITEISIEGSIQDTGTTTSTPKPDPVVPPTITPIPSTTATTTNSSTPKLEGPKIATPFGVRIYNNLADKVDITATAAEVVNKSIEPNGVTTFQILPVSTGGTFSLHVKSENLHDTVSTIKVHAHGRVGDYNREYNNAIVNGGVFTFSYDENAALSSIDMNIELSKYVEEVTTTTTVTPNVG